MFPLFTTRCLHFRHDVRDPGGGSGNCGRECCPVILSKWRLPRHLGICYMTQIYDMGPTALLPLRRSAEDFFALKNPKASAGFEPANLGSKGQHATPRPPKPLHWTYTEINKCETAKNAFLYLLLLSISVNNYSCQQLLFPLIISHANNYCFRQ